MSNLCNVCLEVFNRDSNPAFLCIPCGHVTCESCLENWFKTNTDKTCPECRTPVQSTVYDRALMNVIGSTTTTTPPLASTTVSSDNVYLGTRDRSYELIRDKCEFAVYVIDNSGSMEYYLDGKTFIQDRDGRIVKQDCQTRWTEACVKTLEIAKYNIRREMPASYYLLNPMDDEWLQDRDYIIIDPSQLSRHDKLEAIKTLEKTLLSYKNIRGNTPLDRITHYFANDRDSFITKEAGIVCYNVITDGEPNNKENFEFQLRELSRSQKVWLVINLCTEDQRVVDYYNSLDTKLGYELSGMDVIDDLESEAQEVWDRGNRFFNYSQEIHVCRMAGCFSVVSDWMDEIQLKPHYVDKLIRELTDIQDRSFGYSDYLKSPKNYLASIDQINADYPMVYSVLSQRMVPLLNRHHLHYLMWRTWFNNILAKYSYCLVALVMVAVLLVVQFVR